MGHAVTGHRTAAAALMAMHELPVARADEVLGFDRVVFIPSIAVTLSQLEATMHRLVRPECRSRLGKVSCTVTEAWVTCVAYVMPEHGALRKRNGTLSYCYCYWPMSNAVGVSAQQ